MRRMNVREFRAKISELSNEPIEVTRYSETVGFWVPQGMTTMPKKPGPKTTKWSAIKKAKGAPSTVKPTGDAEIDEWLTKLTKFNEEMRKIGVK